jgi:hypothetical protein
VLQEHGPERDLDVAEQRAGVVLREVVAAEPGPGLRDVAPALLHPGERGVEIPVDRPAGGDVRGHLRQGREGRVLVFLAARLLQPEVLHERQRPAVRQHVRGLLPADPGVDPVERGRAEHRTEPPARQRRVLEPGVDEIHPPGAGQVLPGQGDQARPGLDRGHVQAPGEQAAGQLAGSAADLEHGVAARDPGDLAGPVDQLAGIGRAVAVVLRRDPVEDRAVTPGRGSWRRHAADPRQLPGGWC